MFIAVDVAVRPDPLPTAIAENVNAKNGRDQMEMVRNESTSLSMVWTAFSSIP
jgi:hypothetical protein